MMVQENSKKKKFENIKKHSKPRSVKEKDGRKEVVIKKVN